MSTGTGGITVPKEMLDILKQPGYISVAKGGQRLRRLYQETSLQLDATLLSDFGFACFLGRLDVVKQAVTSGMAPDITQTETQFKFGYATLVVAGSQRVRKGPQDGMNHFEVLKFLLSAGAPPDVEDITGITALSHATMTERPQPDLVRLLLENGADPNHKNRYGEVALLTAFQTNEIASIDLLLEHGADLEIADADGLKPSQFYLTCGAQVTAVVRKWMRKRSGVEAPMDEKKCNACGKKGDGLKLMLCSTCHSARYCSVQCQRSHWPQHKLVCQPFSTANTVTLKPSYVKNGTAMPMSDLLRATMGVPGWQPPPASHTRAAHIPKSLSSSHSKNIVIKVQVPFDPLAGRASTSSNGPVMVYTKNRDFVCRIERVDNPAGYDQIAQTVRTRGVGGAKAYFVAELKSKDELVVKISEVLAEQPW